MLYITLYFLAYVALIVLGGWLVGQAKKNFENEVPQQPE
jgi:hypothetical protein